MLILSQKCYKEALKLFNTKQYHQAYDLLRQARGYAQNALDTAKSSDLYKVHAQMAEVSMAIAECLAYMTSLDDKQDIPLEKLVSQLHLAEEEADTAKTHLSKARQATTDALAYKRKNATEVLNDLAEKQNACEILLKKALMETYFNRGVDEIARIHRYSDQIESQRPGPKAKDFNEETEFALQSLKKSLNIAKELKSNPDQKEIIDCFIELYEESADLFSLMEENENFSQLKLEYLDFMIIEYSNAFHLLYDNQDSDKADVLAMYLSVLNALETKALLLDHKFGLISKEAQDSLFHTCIEMVKFIKKYPFSQFDGAVSPSDALELNSYSFTAHRILAKRFKDKTKKKAHFNSAMQAGEKSFTLSQAMSLSEDLQKDAAKMKLYYVKNTVKKCLKTVAKQDEFSQDVISMFAFTIGRIHRNGGNLLNSLFNLPPETSRKKMGVSVDIAMDSLIQALELTTKATLKAAILDNIKFTLEQHAKHFIYIAKNNPHVIYTMQDDRRSATTSILFDKIKMHAQRSVQKISKEKSKEKLLTFVSEYFTQIEEIFSSEQIVHAIPGLLRECALHLTKAHYDQGAIDNIHNHLNKLASLMATPQQLPQVTLTENGKEEIEQAAEADIKKAWVHQFDNLRTKTQPINDARPNSNHSAKKAVRIASTSLRA